MHKTANRGALVVTGGSRGIGAAVARLAGSRGYRVAILYRERESAAMTVVADVEAAGSEALAVRCDIGNEAEVVGAFDAAATRFGGIAGLVNNAGITGGMSKVADLTATTLEEVCRINIVGAFLCARESVRRMSTRRGGKGGAIVNVSSLAARTGTPNVWIHYAATKGAVDTMTVGLAKEVAADGIRVNAVRPGLIETDIHIGRDPDQLARTLQMVPIGRMGQPDEIAAVVLWLLSDESNYVTGALVDAGGGL
ncbi:MAG TPA: SDR family oxidoreductase [Casimicrobiaceae bacterium]|jgi:NAD(P)-dependent dehydrogenase (short-subunit alcohol dehydrogenase family)